LEIEGRNAKQKLSKWDIKQLVWREIATKSIPLPPELKTSRM
jgi:hypothetical protein